MTQISDKTRDQLQRELSRQKLPADFAVAIVDYYLPVADRLNAKLACPSSPSLVAVQGSQGSGKSTCASFLKLLLESEYGCKTVIMSIDDFYLTRKQRAKLAETIHPLLFTRGVPGTHDIQLLNQVLTNLRKQRSTRIPVFDKASDDRADKDQWPVSDGDINLIILEGWCVGISPQTEIDLVQAVNELEKCDDPSGAWRLFVNDQLRGQYQDLFKQFEQQIVLQAPGFDVVYEWRLKQEQKLIAELNAKGRDTSKTLSPEQISRFISHYQRLTEHALKTMPAIANFLLLLNQDHSFRELQIAGHS